MTLIKRTNNLFPSVFDEFFGRDWLGTEADLTSSKSFPAVNIKESESAFEIELISPGLNKKDFKIEIDDNQLIVGYEKEETNENKNDDKVSYRRREFRNLSFKRSFSLPKTVLSDKIKANYKDGILTLNIPKVKEEQKPSRLIEIS